METEDILFKVNKITPKTTKSECYMKGILVSHLLANLIKLGAANSCLL